ncbi:hypothetical protein NHJ13051_000413 [Beauveria bassiana]
MTISEKDLDSGDNASTGMGVSAQMDKESERRVLSKFDWFVMPQMSILVLFAYLDRTNIGNARVFGFEESTDMSGTDFNNISMFFYITYIIFETPWVMAVRRFGPGRVLAVAIVCWSAVTLGTGFVHNYRQVVACRVLLGAFEAGLFPALTFVISGIYPAASQGKRIAVLYISIALSGALGGLIAYGIQSMGAQRGLAAWRWLFIMEGAVSFAMGALCWVSLPGTPETAWFLDEAERNTMALLKARDHPYEGATDNFSWKQVGLAVSDPLVWLASIALFCSSIAMFGFSTFLPTLLKGMQYTSLQANYLSIPVYVLASIGTGLTTYISDRIGRRAICLIHSPILVMIGYAVGIGSSNKSAGYFGMFIVGAGVYSYNTVLLTWVSNNIHPDYKRSVAIAMVVSIGNAAGLAASQIYPIGDAPRYLVGNSVSLGFESLALACVALIYMLLRYRTGQKKKLMSQGIESNGREGDQSLDFDYVIRHTAAGSRRYRSKAQRPCDLCRARKALSGTRSRPMRSSPSSHSADGADSFAGQEPYTASVSQRTHSLMDSTPSFEQSIGGMMPTQWSLDLEQLGQTETFMQDIPSFWSLSYNDASVADVADIVEPGIGNEVPSRPQTQTTLNRHHRSTSFIGYSNESDPFLLEHYPYSASDELDFFMVTYRRPSLQGVSVGHPPIHFLQSKPQAALQNQEAMGACLALKNERDVLNDLVSVEMGVALLRLYLRFIFQNLPIVSVAKLQEDEEEFIRSTSPGVLAGMFALALPFTSWDEQLCLDSAYSKPDTGKLWQISYCCLQKELHFPSLSTIQTCLLLLNTTTFDPVAVETPFAWSLACSVLAIAQSLGLHLEPGRWKIPEDEIRLRRRLWSAVVVEHSWRAVTHGRSTMLRDDDCNVAPISYADFAGTDNPSNAADYFISFCLLTNLVNEICRNFFTLRAVSRIQNLTDILDRAKPLQRSLYTWLESLPQSLRLDQVPDTTEEIPDSRASLHIAYFTAHVLLYRALLRPIVGQNFVVNDETAHQVLQEARDFMGTLIGVYKKDKQPVKQGHNLRQDIIMEQVLAAVSSRLVPPPA